MQFCGKRPQTGVFDCGFVKPFPDRFGSRRIPGRQGCFKEDACIAGLTLLGIPDNLDQLAERAGEFDALLVFSHDLWADPRAAKLEAAQNSALAAQVDALPPV